MKMLFDSEQFNKAKVRDKLPLECTVCGKTFYKLKRHINEILQGKGCQVKGDCCSEKCYCLHLSQEIECVNCGKTFRMTNANIKKSSNHFCCQSCATTYNNKHKTYGVRRSKLEEYLEQQIELHYPQLGCHYNKHDAIDSELDFYFPTLKLAIELNGIFHYEPIYGQDKLDKIQVNDQQKAINCYKAGIEFCTIDSSKCKHLTQKCKDEFWSITQTIIIKVLNRHKV